MLNDIGKSINRMYAMLKRDTKTKHIASSMKPIVTVFLKGVSTNKVDYDRLIANNKADIARLEKKRLSLTGEKQKIVTNEIERLKNSISVYESYIRINKSTADALASVLKSYDSAEDTQHLFDKDLYDRVQEFAERMNGRTLYELSDSEVSELRDMTRMVSRYISKSNKVFTDSRNRTVAQIAEKVKNQVENTQKRYSKAGKVVHDFIEKQRYDIMKPWELFEATGSAEMVQLYRNLQRGEGMWKNLIFKYADYWRTNAQEKGITKKALEEKHSILLENGTEIALRTDDIMSLYAMSKREQARGHLLSETGGYRLPGHVVEVTKARKRKGERAKFEYVEGAEPVRLTENDLNSICSKLTDGQREFADIMQKYMSTELAEDGNCVSRQMYDVDTFKEKFYFPICTDKTYGKMCAMRAEGNVKLKSKSFTKETVEKASGPLILRGFSKVWSEHANEMALYSSFVMPLEDIQRVLDYKEPGFSMRQHLGERLSAEIDDFLNAVNGGIRKEDASWIVKAFNRSKAAKVMGNFRVAIQQPTAIVRAMALIDPKYFIGVNFNVLSPKQLKSHYREMLTYTSTAGVKELGGVDVNTSGSISDYLTDLGKGNTLGKKISNAADNAFSFLAEKGDQAAWLAIWEACKREARDQNKNLSAEEIKKHAAERFDEITNKTQVYDSVFSRSKIMRSGSVFDKMITSFMAEPLTTVNMIFEAQRLWKTGNRTAAKRYLSSVVLCTVVTNIFASLVDAGRDDDDDETYLEKYIAAFGDNLIHDINPFNYVPVFRDISSLFEGYDIERADMSLISDAVNSYRRLKKAIKNDKEYGKYIAELGMHIVDFTKIPASSLTRDINALGNTLFNPSMWDKSTKTGIKAAAVELASGIPIASNFISPYKDSDKLYYAICDGDDEYYKRVERSIRRAGEKKGKTEDDINDNVNKAIVDGLKDNDTRIAVAAEAHMNGDTSEYIELIGDIVSDGFEKELVQRAILSIENELNGEDTEADKALKGTLYTKSDVIGGIEAGNISVLEAYFYDKVDYYTDQGKKDPKKDALESLKNMLGNHYRPLYKASYDSDDWDECDRIRDMLTDLRMDGERVYKSSTLSGWRKNTSDD